MNCPMCSHYHIPMIPLTIYIQHGYNIGYTQMYHECTQFHCCYIDLLFYVTIDTVDYTCIYELTVQVSSQTIASIILHKI